MFFWSLTKSHVINMLNLKLQTHVQLNRVFFIYLCAFVNLSFFIPNPVNQWVTISGGSYSTLTVVVTTITTPRLERLSGRDLRMLKLFPWQWCRYSLERADFVCCPSHILWVLCLKKEEENVVWDSLALSNEICKLISGKVYWLIMLGHIVSPLSHEKDLRTNTDMHCLDIFIQDFSVGEGKLSAMIVL